MQADEIVSLLCDSAARNAQLEEVCCALPEENDESTLQARVVSLLAQGANPFANDGRAMVAALETRRALILTCLLESSKQGRTPHPVKTKLLNLACRQPDCRFAQILLEHGAEPNAEKGKALAIAIAHNSMELVTLLFQYGAQVSNKHLFLDANDLSFQDEFVCKTLPQLVGRFGSVDMLHALQARGLDLDAVAEDVMTEAVYAKQTEIIRVLWQFLHARDAFYHASLFVAAREGWVTTTNNNNKNIHPSLYTLVHEMGAPLSDFQLVCDAAEHGHLDAVKFLLQCFDEQKRPNQTLESCCDPTPTLQLTSGIVYSRVWGVFCSAARRSHVHICNWLLDEFSECCWRNRNNQKTNFLHHLLTETNGFSLSTMRLILPRVLMQIEKTDWSDASSIHSAREWFNIIFFVCHSTETLVHVLEFLDGLFAAPYAETLLPPEFVLGSLKQRISNHLSNQLQQWFDDGDDVILHQDLILEWMARHSIPLSAEEGLQMLSLSKLGKYNNKKEKQVLSRALKSLQTFRVLSLADIFHFVVEHELEEWIEACLAEHVPLFGEYDDGDDIVFRIVGITGKSDFLKEYFASQNKQRVPLLPMAAVLATLETTAQPTLLKTKIGYWNALGRCILDCTRQGYSSALTEILLHHSIPAESLQPFLSTAITHKQKSIVVLLTLYGCQTSPIKLSTWTDGLEPFLLELLDSGFFSSPLCLRMDSSFHCSKSNLVREIVEQMRTLPLDQQERFLNKLVSGLIVVEETKQSEHDSSEVVEADDIAFVWFKDAIEDGCLDQARQWLQKRQFLHLTNEKGDEWVYYALETHVSNNDISMVETLAKRFPTQTRACCLDLLEEASCRGHAKIIELLLPFSSRETKPPESQAYIYLKCLKAALCAGNTAAFSFLAEYCISVNDTERRHIQTLCKTVDCGNLSDPVCLNWAVDGLVEQLQNKFDNSWRLVSACIPVARTDSNFYALLGNCNRNSSLIQLLFDCSEYRLALCRVFSCLDARGVSECARVFCALFSTPGNAHKANKTLRLFLQTCLPRLTDSFQKTRFVGKLAELVKSGALSKFSDTTARLVLQCVNLPQDELKLYIPPMRLARFAKQEWYAVYSVIQTLAVEAYNSTNSSLPNPVKPFEPSDHPLPLQLLEHVTIQECFLSFCWCLSKQEEERS